MFNFTDLSIITANFLAFPNFLGYPDILVIHVVTLEMCFLNVHEMSTTFQRRPYSLYPIDRRAVFCQRGALGTNLSAGPLISYTDL